MQLSKEVVSLSIDLMKRFKKLMIMTNLIINRRELAVKLSKQGVNLNEISKKLNRTVEMWVSRKECKIENGILFLSK